MAKITIDGKDFDMDQLSNEAKNFLGALQFTEVEIQRLQATLAAMQTARAVYGASLKQALENGAVIQPTATFQGDTIQFK